MFEVKIEGTELQLWANNSCICAMPVTEGPAFRDALVAKFPIKVEKVAE